MGSLSILLFLLGLLLGLLIGGCGFFLWVNRRTGNLYTEWEGYRLGDLLKSRSARESWRHGERFHRKRFPQSLVVEYLKETKELSDFDVLHKIIQGRILDGEGTCVVHLRVGDIVERSKLTDAQREAEGVTCDQGHIYAHPLEWYRQKIALLKERKINRVILVSGSHVRYRAYPKSNAYIESVSNLFQSEGFEVELRLAGNPDEDIIFMSTASHFIKSGGGFSKMAEKLVLMNGGESI